MKKFRLSRGFVALGLVLSAVSSGVCVPAPVAGEEMDEVVYFIDGSSVRGTIVYINREKIQVRQPDGTIIERSTKKIYRFSTQRSFREIYEQALETEDRKF